MDPLIHFLMTFPTGLDPIVGQQLTYVAEHPLIDQRVDLLIERALAHTQSDGLNKPLCDLAVTGIVAGESRNWLLNEAGEFVPDQLAGAKLTAKQIRGLAIQPNNRLTYSCLPPGAGTRVALDRDEDGVLNGDDQELLGKLATYYEAAVPNAPSELDLPVSSEAGGFDREMEQKKRGTYPNFTLF